MLPTLTLNGQRYSWLVFPVAAVAQNHLPQAILAAESLTALDHAGDAVPENPKRPVNMSHRKDLYINFSRIREA